MFFFISTVQYFILLEIGNEWTRNYIIHRSNGLCLIQRRNMSEIRKMAMSLYFSVGEVFQYYIYIDDMYVIFISDNLFMMVLKWWKAWVVRLKQRSFGDVCDWTSILHGELSIICWILVDHSSSRRIRLLLYLLSVESMSLLRFLGG